ncbi:MAG: hypothetical protein ACOYEG_08010 [Petrimonas sp.]|jgi:hypothetical protein
MTNKTQLSSSGTFFFKYVLPLGVFFLTFMELMYIIFFGRFLDKEFLFILTMLFFFLLILCAFFLFCLISLHNVYYYQKETWVESFGRTRKFDNKEIKKVTQFLMYSYKLEFYDKNTKSIWFIAHLNDVLPALLKNKKPYSIKIYEETLKMT